MRKKILAAFIAASVLALALPAGGAYAAEPGEGAAEEAYTETDETGISWRSKKRSSRKSPSNWRKGRNS